MTNITSITEIAKKFAEQYQFRDELAGIFEPADESYGEHALEEFVAERGGEPLTADERAEFVSAFVAEYNRLA